MRFDASLNTQISMERNSLVSIDGPSFSVQVMVSYTLPVTPEVKR